MLRMKSNLIKADNAVILAAGFSSRFVPICFDMPKGLLPVFGETLIERQILQLREVGVKNIAVITGSHAEQFSFLREKYDIELVFNPDYAVKNNFASVYAARGKHLGNTIISSSDLFFTRNIFQSRTEHPYYASVFIRGKTNQRALKLDKNDKIISVQYGGYNTWITFGGHAFFTKDFSDKLIEKIKLFYDNPEYANKYWVDFQDAYLNELPMHIKRCKRSDIVEFNTLEALWNFDRSFIASSISDTMSCICMELNVKNERELSDFIPLKQGNLLVGCSFIFNGSQYQYIAREKILRKN
jgi:CTP:phosphocholine cytidylyltransferase-like protein